ncbi:hypothetical protein FIU89_19505 [Roseovarius sp. THAF27]|nr:hypothetical protein FIU89_19505 [Roseovarius sp. THAF27]QFT98151.1 hypothetical protein FIU85_12610 [Roseovarius sp. THAF8]
MPSPRSRNARPLPGSACDVLSKIALIFLAFIAVLAMFGRLRFPGQKKLESARCPHCRRFRIGKGPCQCREGKS